MCLWGQAGEEDLSHTSAILFQCNDVTSLILARVDTI